MKIWVISLFILLLGLNVNADDALKEMKRYNLPEDFMRIVIKKLK